MVICSAINHDFERKLYIPTARKISKSLAAVYKTVNTNETVYRRTFHGKQRHQMKLCWHAH